MNIQDIITFVKTKKEPKYIVSEEFRYTGGTISIKRVFIKRQFNIHIKYSEVPLRHTLFMEPIHTAWFPNKKFSFKRIFSQADTEIGLQGKIPHPEIQKK